ncbi:MAG: hypothetical protein IJZ63_03645, partial [Clostridia bacterium]|nr:hypothetical protein [Clostridia bacterium]
NALLRDGAIPLLDSSDIFNQYIAKYPEIIDIKKAFDDENEEKDKKIKKNLNLVLSNEAQIVYNNMNKQKFTADDFFSLNLNDNELLSALTELEIEGVIRALPGGAYEVINH